MKKSLYTGLIAFVVIAIVSIPSFAANPTPVLLVDFGGTTANNTDDTWIHHTQNGGGAINPTISDNTITFTTSSGGNFYASNVNVNENTADFTVGEYVDLKKNTHTTIFAEMAATLGLKGSIDSSIYQDGVANGGYCGHTVTIGGLDASKTYVMYYVAGGEHGNAGRVIAGFKLTGYAGAPKLDYVVTGAHTGTGTSVASKYQSASIGSELKSAANSYLVVRVSYIQPNSEGNITFKLHENGDYASINAFAIAEIDPLTSVTRTLESASETWGVAEEWSTGAIPTANTDVELTVTSAEGSTLTLDVAASVNALTISGDYALRFAGEESLSADSTAVNTDTDVSGITANLGATTIADGKCLSVGDRTTFTRVAATGILEYKNYVPSQYDLTLTDSTVRFVGTATGENMLGGTNGKVEIGEGAQITVPHLRFLNSASYNNSVTLDVNGTLTVNTETTDPYGERGSYKGILFGHWHGQGVYNINEGGSLIGEETYLMTVYTAEAQSINIKGGTLQVRALVANNANSSITLSDGGTLKLATWPNTGAITQNYGYGTLAAYVSTSDSSTTGWTNPQAVSFTDATNGTTLDPNGLTIAFTGAITDAAPDTGALLVVEDSSESKNGAVNLANAATLPDTLRYIVKSGTLILPAGAEGADGNAYVTTDGGTLRLMLAEAQMLTGYTAQVAEGSNVEFYDNNGYAITGDTVSGNAYTPSRNTWTKGSDGNWATESNWSNGSLPGEEDSVCISITEDTTITLASAVTVANLEVKGSGTLTIAGAKLTVSNLMIANTSVTAGADLLGFANLLIGDEMSVSVENASELTVNSINGGTFIKSGQGNLHMSTTDAAFITLKDTILNVQAGALIMRNSINLENATLNFTDGTYWKAHGWPSIRDTIVVNTAGDLTFGAADGTIPSLGNGRNGKVIKKGAGTFTFSARNMTNAIAFQIDEGAVGILEGGTLSGVISGEGKLINKSTNRTLILSNANNSYTGGTEIENGAILRVNGLAFLGPSGDVNIADGGVLNIYTTANTDTDHDQDWDRLKGNGTVAYNASGNFYRTFPTFDKAFPTTLTVENNLATGLILPEAGKAYKIGSLQGDGVFRVDYNNGSRTLEIIQSKNTTYSGGMLHNAISDRLADFYLSGTEGATEKTLTYSGTTTVAKPMTVNASGVLNLTGEWTGAMTVAGTIGGTGTIGGALTFNAGSTLDVSSEAPLTVTGALTLAGKVTVKLPENPEVGMALLKYKGSDTQPSIKMLEVGRYTLVEETTDGVTTVKLGPKSCLYIRVR